MARGVAIDIVPSYGEPEPFTAHVIGIVAAEAFPDWKSIRERLAVGYATHPDAVFVIRARDHKIRKVLEELGIEPVQIPPPWRGATGYRDWEIVTGCEYVLVFHDGKSSVTTWFAEEARFLEDGIKGPYFDKIHVIDKGKKKAPAAPKRRPTRKVDN